MNRSCFPGSSGSVKRFAIEPANNWLAVSHRGDDRWRDQEPSQRELSDQALLKRVARCFDRSKGRHTAEVILHTDRGIEFMVAAFLDARLKAGMDSVNRAGQCIDTAYMEPLYHSIKGELIRLSHFRNMDHLRREIGRFINQFYNTVWVTQVLSIARRWNMEYERMAD